MCEAQFVSQVDFGDGVGEPCIPSRKALTLSSIQSSRVFCHVSSIRYGHPNHAILALCVCVCVKVFRNTELQHQLFRDSEMLGSWSPGKKSEGNLSLRNARTTTCSGRSAGSTQRPVFAACCLRPVCRELGNVLTT